MGIRIVSSKRLWGRNKKSRSESSVWTTFRIVGMDGCEEAFGGAR